MKKSSLDFYDALIVGGGPAGLSAALILARCRRKVIVCDSGRYRNQASYAMYGYLSRDGIAPKRFLSICRIQLKKYSNIRIEEDEVVRINKQPRQFIAELRQGQKLAAKGVILATGIRDEIPQLKGIRNFFGKSVFLCPYCDGWEFRDKRIVAYGRGHRGPCTALLMKRWSPDVVLCSDGKPGGTPEEQRRLKELNIPVIEEPVERLEGRSGRLQGIVFAGGKTIAADALFFNTGIQSNTDLGVQLGCRVNERGELQVGPDGSSCVPRVYAAGDASPDIKLAIVAAAEGTKAAYALNKDLLAEEKLVKLRS
jgi:thioredoxin reductase